jgi:hypothetical protein
MPHKHCGHDKHNNACCPWYVSWCPVPGPTGPAGLGQTGPTGPTGLGQTGPTGFGQTGPTGPTGFGQTGPTGFGQTGSTGGTGPTGPCCTGDTGPPGPPGPPPGDYALEFQGGVTSALQPLSFFGVGGDIQTNTPGAAGGYPAFSRNALPILHDNTIIARWVVRVTLTFTSGTPPTLAQVELYGAPDGIAPALLIDSINIPLVNLPVGSTNYVGCAAEDIGVGAATCFAIAPYFLSTDSADVTNIVVSAVVYLTYS